MKIKKAIIPAAGRGLRMRSLSGALPKEMLPLDGKPIIRHAVEMHRASGIEEIAVILHPEKEMIRRYLEGNPDESDPFVEPDGEYPADEISFRFYYQEERRGVVDAVSLARDFIGDDWFALVMPDSLLFGEVPFIAQLLPWAGEPAEGIIGFIMLEKDRMDLFGNVGLLDLSAGAGPFFNISNISNKNRGKVVFDGPVHAKGFAGGIYSPAYFAYPEEGCCSGGAEIDDIPLHQAMAARGKLYGVRLEGVAYDLGDADGYKSAVDHFEELRKRKIPPR